MFNYQALQSNFSNVIRQPKPGLHFIPSKLCVELTKETGGVQRAFQSYHRNLELSIWSWEGTHVTGARSREVLIQSGDQGIRFCLLIVSQRSLQRRSREMLSSSETF